MAWKTLALTFGLTCWVVLSVFTPEISAAFELESVVAYWLFEEEDELPDSSGNGHNGSFTGGGIKSVEGKFGDALEFTGGSKVIVPHSEELSLSTYTLMAWISVPSPSGYQLIVGKDGWPVRNYTMFVAGSGALHHALNAPGAPAPPDGDPGEWYFDTQKTVTGGDWRHVAITYDKSKLKSYIDGELEAEADFDFDPAQSEIDVEIGRDFRGIIDEVLIANEAFSEEDIRQAMEMGLEEFITRKAAVSASGKLVSTWGAIRSTVAD